MLPGTDPLQQDPEVGGARAQHHLVCLQVLALGRQGDVDKLLRFENVLEGCRQRQLVVVPLEAKLVTHGDGGGVCTVHNSVGVHRSQVSCAPGAGQNNNNTQRRKETFARGAENASFK